MRWPGESTCHRRELHFSPVDARVDGKLLTFARDQLLRRIEGARKRVWLVSPFLTAPIAGRICEAVGQSSAGQRRLLTALVARSVQVGVLDPKALLKLQGYGFAIASIPNLHAKVSLVDSDWGLVGSGNLTGTGLGSGDGGNVELGVVLTPTQIRGASTLFAGWWDEAEPVSAEVIESYAALSRFPRTKTSLGDFGTALDLPQTEELDRVLGEDAAVAHSRRYWIKSNYHRRDEEVWWHRGWISGWRKAPYEVGDLIVLYLSARDGGPANCPAVVRVVSPSRHDRDWAIAQRDVAVADKWPYVTKTSVVAEVPIPSGVPLAVAGKSGQSVQGGYCSISREQFEQVALAMRA